MWSEIVSVEEVGEMEMIDIEVSNDHLFYANGILTHNSSSDVELTDTSESFGLPATADFMFALINTESLEQLGQLMIKQLKNRYADPGINKKFVIGIDRSKMRLYDVEQSAQVDIIDSGQDDDPVFDRSSMGQKSFSNSNYKSKFGQLKV